jgi:D-alanyl-D-alanine carboxypeptidase
MRHDGAMSASATSLASWPRARLVVILGLVGGASCVTPPSPRPTPLPVPTASPTPSGQAQPQTTSPPDPAPAAGPTDVGGSPGREVAASPPSQSWPALRLPWVNPARCPSRCDFDPGDELLAISPSGGEDPRGRLRVARSIVEPLRALLQAARAAGHALRIESAYRSYSEQERLFASIKEIGRAARPGHSEHQLGTTVDLRLPTGAAIAWLAEHAAEHGFTRSYPPGKQRLTGYRPEPWHVRYVGRELAQLLQSRGLILEEAFRAQPSLGESGSCGDCPSPASRAACGSVTAQGQCQGSVLSYCYEGVLTSVDCGLSGETCGTVPAAAAAAAAAAALPPAAEISTCVPAPKPAVSLNQGGGSRRP